MNFNIDIKPLYRFYSALNPCVSMSRDRNNRSRSHIRSYIHCVSCGSD